MTTDNRKTATEVMYAQHAEEYFQWVMMTDVNEWLKICSEADMTALISFIKRKQQERFGTQERQEI